MEKEEALVKDIEYLESLEKPHNAQLEILTDKKAELETIRSYKIQGEVIRSRTQWLIEGERQTRYFCNLEKRQFVEKTIKKWKHMVVKFCKIRRKF